MSVEFEDPSPSWAYRLFRWLVFKVGDTRWIGWRHFPFVATWAVDEHDIDLNEVILDAIPRLLPGDVLLHRDRGFLSNLAIGGAMVHAALYIGNGQVVEAISEGVIRRHAAHILHSDRAMIVRPRFEGPETHERAVAEALVWAERIVGFPYDPLFRFQCKQQRELIAEKGPERAVRRQVRFCCTKVPYFCYLDYVEALDLRRRRAVTPLHMVLSWIGLHPGRTVVDADMYVRGNFDIVWASRGTTVPWARRRGARGDYLQKLEAYWAREATQSSLPPA